MKKALLLSAVLSFSLGGLRADENAPEAVSFEEGLYQGVRGLMFETVTLDAFIEEMVKDLKFPEPKPWDHWGIDQSTMGFAHFTIEQDRGFQTFDEVLQSMVRSKAIGDLRSIVGRRILEDPAFQKEILTTLEREVPKQLQAVLKLPAQPREFGWKEGAMPGAPPENLALRPIRAALEKAVLTSSSIQRIEAALTPHGRTISQVYVNGVKFESLNGGPHFSGVLALKVTKR